MEVVGSSKWSDQRLWILGSLLLTALIRGGLGFEGAQTGEMHVNCKSLENVLSLPNRRRSLLTDILYLIAVSDWFERMLRQNNAEWFDAATWRSKVCPCKHCDQVMTGDCSGC
eukprot:5993898-Amphidinium_carterae.2